MSDAAEAGPGRGPDAVEQVQRAVLTLIGAARVVLDAFEHVVADRSRLDDLAASGRDLVSSLAATVFPHAPARGEPDPSSDG